MFPPCAMSAWTINEPHLPDLEGCTRSLHFSQATRFMMEVTPVALDCSLGTRPYCPTPGAGGLPPK